MLRELTIDELDHVSGGVDIVVVGSSTISGSVAISQFLDDLSAWSSIQYNATNAMQDADAADNYGQEETIFVNGATTTIPTMGSAAPMLAMAAIPHPYYYLFADSDTEDFEEYMEENGQFSSEELDNMIIVHASLGNREFIVHFDGNGSGAIYIVRDRVFTDDEFEFFSLVENVQISFGQSVSAGISGRSGVLEIGNNASIAFTLIGPG